MSTERHDVVDENGVEWIIEEQLMTGRPSVNAPDGKTGDEPSKFTLLDLRNTYRGIVDRSGDKTFVNVSTGETYIKSA